MCYKQFEINDLRTFAAPLCDESLCVDAASRTQRDIDMRWGEGRAWNQQKLSSTNAWEDSTLTTASHESLINILTFRLWTPVIHLHKHTHHRPVCLHPGPSDTTHGSSRAPHSLLMCTLCHMSRVLLQSDPDSYNNEIGLRYNYYIHNWSLSSNIWYCRKISYNQLDTTNSVNLLNFHIWGTTLVLTFLGSFYTSCYWGKIGSATYQNEII